MNDSTNDRYLIVARDKPGLLIAMMRQLAGDAHISFEGDLSHCLFQAALDSSGNETSALRHQTIFPRQDFLVLQLSAESVSPILDVILPEYRFKDEIIHIQIESNGQLQFRAYDQFHHDCIVGFQPGVNPELLNRLHSSGVIRTWSVRHVTERGKA